MSIEKFKPLSYDEQIVIHHILQKLNDSLLSVVSSLPEPYTAILIEINKTQAHMNSCISLTTSNTSIPTITLTFTRKEISSPSADPC